MTNYLFGHIPVAATDRGFLQTAGQEVVYSAAQEYIQRINSELMGAISIFVDGTTTAHTQRYKLAGGGYLQRRNNNGSFDSVKPTGAWDVAYPLEEWGAALSWNNISLAYATGEEISNAINTVVNQDINTMRFEILYRLFNNTSRTFTDEIHGNLTIQPLASGDADVLYPPVLGADSPATDNHYLGSSYDAASINDTNDPFPTIVDELEEHFGTPAGGSEIVVFINKAQASAVRDLAAFTAVKPNGVVVGNDTSVAMIPAQVASMTTAKTLGYHEEAGCWIVQWPYVPASYMLGIHLDAPAPLRMRVDPDYTGLGTGLQLVAQDEQFPFTTSTWSHRFGIGTANRLNGVVLDLSNTDSDYDIPATYS